MLGLETFTIWAQFSIILAIWTKHGPKLPSKFAYSPSFDCLLQKSCPKTEAFKLHHAKEHKIMYQKQ